MANEIKTLYSDENKQNALYPRTKFSAVSDDDGNTLGNVASYEAVDVSTIGEVNVIAGYDGTIESALLKNINGQQVFPQASFIGIDTSNLLSNTTLGTGTYTATQDCILIGGLSTSGQAQELKIDGVIFGSMSEYDYVIVPLKKGQILSTSGSYGFNRYTYVFGVKR